MRKAGQDYGIIVIDDKFIGISLGYDFCAEHEWGIKDIKRRFGIPDVNKKNLGVESRSISKNIECLVLKKETYKKQKFALLYTGYLYRTLEESEKQIPHYLERYKEDILWKTEYDKKHPPRERDPKDPIVTAWSSEAFGIGVMGEKEVQYLEELYQAFNDINIAITYINMMPNNPFSNSALCILIKDRIPEEFKKMMYDADKEYQDRIDYEKKIGMTKIIEKHGNKNGYHEHGYYIACSPKWIDYNNEDGQLENRKKKYHTKYDIIYWVNYSDDDDTHGYFSVEEVKEWLTGKKKLSEIRKENEAKYNV